MNMTEPTTVGARLRYAREQAGLSVKQVEKWSGWSARYIIEMVEKGEYVGHDLEILANHYGVEIEWIRTGQPQPVTIPETQLRKLAPADRVRLVEFVGTLKLQGEGVVLK